MGLACPKPVAAGRKIILKVAGGRCRIYSRDRRKGGADIPVCLGLADRNVCPTGSPPRTTDLAPGRKAQRPHLTPAWPLPPDSPSPGPREDQPMPLSCLPPASRPRPLLRPTLALICALA